MQYIERGNICIGYGGKEISYERFFAIEDGKIKKLHEGSYGAMNLYTGEAPIYEYTWDGEKISGEEYNRKVSGVIDKSKAKYPSGEELCKADEMIDKIIAW